MAGTCKYCGFSGTHEMLADHACHCPAETSPSDAIAKKMTNVKFIGSFQGLLAKGHIFTVTSIQTTIYKNKEKSANRRCWGWFPTEKEAKHAVDINAGDMMEISYTYVVIEKHPAGILVEPVVIAWYKWTGRYPKGKIWKRCKAPEWAEGTIGWGFG